MDVIKRECKMCYDCMQKHEVQVVRLEEVTIFQNEEVKFQAEYEYCENTKDFIENEEQLRINKLAMKEAYKNQQGL